MMDAQVVYERQPGGDLQRGPCEFVRVGVRFGDRVFWVESAYFPGSNGIEFQGGEALAKEIVSLCTADHTAVERGLRKSIVNMLNGLALDRERQQDGHALFTPYIGMCNDMLAAA